ncbi:N-6 DNA methylase [Thalassotalea sp. G2M2-11]|uniref:N-6 DNA methylase n=1 Tax=Thalassotalea sp. G2M2-11 TaxID=2787627 RepID=UPI0019D0141F|nr:N-6 DNA methylase [Thalassotalea sp. G2M2-11]
MNNNEDKLFKVAEYIRKDSGVNNAIDAMEQLSLLLLFHCVINQREFKGELLDSQYYFDEFWQAQSVRNFSHIRDVFSNAINRSSNNLFFEYKNIEEIFDSIPFKLRSNKIFRVVVELLSQIEINDNLAFAYDKLITNMIIGSVSSGVYHTPSSVVKAIVTVMELKGSPSIFDPAMGTGRFLIEANKLLEESSSSNHKFNNIVGNDISPFAHLVGTLNLLLNDVTVSNISLKDSLLEQDDRRFDYILSGIPFGKVNDINKYDYFQLGQASSLEEMFLDIIMRKLQRGGKAAVIVPDSILFKKGHWVEYLRKKLLTEFDLHSILSIPKGMLDSYKGGKASVLFFSNQSPSEDIWYYELQNARPSNKRSSINEDDFQEFTSLFSSRKNTPNSCLISKQEIFDDSSFNLLLSLPQKEESSFKYRKSEIVSSLKNEQLSLNKLLDNHFDTITKEFDVEYINKVTIGSISNIKTGNNLNKSEVSTTGSFPVYGGNGIIGYYHESNRSRDTIIIGKVGTHCGNIHFSLTPYWLTSNALSLEVKEPNVIYTPYLAHVLKCLELNKLSRGTAQKFIAIERLKSLEVSLPTFEQQVELSNWFTTLEENKSAIQRLLLNFTDSLDSVTSNSIVEKALKR